MEGQPIPRPQPLNIHAHHPKLRQTISSPATSVTSPIVLKGVATPKYTKVTKKTPETLPEMNPNELTVNRGWTSFDESPVHSTQGENFSNSEKRVWKSDSKWENPSPERVNSRQEGAEEGGQDPWVITVEQRDYYTKQFATIQPDLDRKIDGQTARNFFTKSKLPIFELSHIWELSDMDKDGHLTLDEFCAAFHLVVARKNGYDLPPRLPQGLVPTLIDIGGAEVATRGDLDPFASDLNSKQKDGSREEWETFSDRTSSSTTLANFDQVPDSNQESLHCPVALRMTPSQQVKGEDTTLDEGSTTSSPRGRGNRRPATNPYGCLKNEFSETESCDDAGKREATSPVSLPSAGESPRGSTSSKEDSFRRGQRQGRSSTAGSSSSSVASSDHSSDNHSFHDNRSDPEHSDWSSRPLRPRSDSNSSLEGAPLPPTIPAPTPPPRPRVDPEQGPRSNSLDKNQVQVGLQEPERRVDGPTPPPRPTTNNNVSKEKAPVLPQESFADFSNFNQTSQNNETATLEKPTNQESEVKKPIPAPRPHKEALKSSDSMEMEGKDSEGGTHKKPPTKPPRTRVKSSEVLKDALTLTPLSISTEGTKIDPPPAQDHSRGKSDLQDRIRDLKNTNTQLSRLNGDLQQSLKDVMETRITVEMNIHQMRPFSQ